MRLNKHTRTFNGLPIICSAAKWKKKICIAIFLPSFWPLLALPYGLLRPNTVIVVITLRSSTPDNMQIFFAAIFLCKLAADAHYVRQWKIFLTLFSCHQHTNMGTTQKKNDRCSFLNYNLFHLHTNKLMYLCI